MKRSPIIGIIFMLALVQLGLATTPATITYQGVLKDDKGDIVPDGSYSVTFRLYDAEIGGTNVDTWTETHSVATTGGVFSVELGTQMSLAAGGKFDIPYWLEIEVGGVTLTPRTELTAVPYAMASRAVRGSWNELESRGRLGINTEGTADTTKAIVLTDAGTVGIGTTVPEYPLHVVRNDTGVYVNLEGYGDDFNYSGLMLTSQIDGRYWQLLHRSIASRQNNFLIQYNDGAWHNQFTITPSGNVGIGTTLPSATLEVVGTVKADTLMLATPAERWYSIPHHEFDAPSNVVRTDFATYSNSANQYVEFMAPVHLPHGALVTQFQATAGDTSTGNMSVELRAYADNGTWWQLAQLIGFDYGLVTDSLAVSAYVGEVRNRTRAYYIKATWWVPPPEWMAGTFEPQDVYIRSARIKYTVDQPLP